MATMPFSFNGWEIFLLIVLAVLIFGPDKLPDLARKTARVIHFLRNVANNATASVRSELGPEYANLSVADLNPRALVQKELDKLGLDEMKADVESLKTEMADVVEQPRVPADTWHDDTRADAPLASGESAPYDIDAT